MHATCRESHPLRQSNPFTAFSDTGLHGIPNRSEHSGCSCMNTPESVRKNFLHNPVRNVKKVFDAGDAQPP